MTITRRKMTTLFEMDPEVTRQAKLPELAGSPQLVCLGEGLRLRKLAEIEKHLREHRLYVESLRRQERHDRADYEAARLRLSLDQLARLERETDSRYWITHRENTARELLTGSDAKPGDTWDGARSR